MTFLAHKLRDRIQIRKTVDTANDSGGYDRSYETLATVWGECIPASDKIVGSYIRGVQVNPSSTHIVKIRRVSIETLGKEYSSGFDEGFNIFGDLNLVKSEYYLFVQRGSTVKGQSFRVLGMQDVKSRKEYLRISVEEIEEQNTGYAA